jgi:hypothetical protein
VKGKKNRNKKKELKKALRPHKIEMTPFNHLLISRES